MRDGDNTGLKYVAPLAESIGWTDKQTIEALNSMPEAGDVAGTSLRRILMLLCGCSVEMINILNKYGIKYYEIDPCKNSLPGILKVISDSGMKSRGIFYLFNCEASGLDFIDLVHAYRLGEIKDACEC